ncbi:Flp pilus assembly protein CpaB [Bradyrhizobium sp. OAE829]
MWKVKRMNTARIVVLTIAIGAGGIAPYPASGSAAPDPVAELQTTGILVAKGDIGLGQSLKAENAQWQTWPAATASGSFISRANKAGNKTDDQPNRRGDSISLVRYGVASQQSVQT